MGRETNGLLMIAASLVVIATILALVTQREIGFRTHQIRHEGSSLANALARVPLDRLAPSDRTAGPLALLRSTQSDSSFAYALVVAPDGRTLGSVDTLEVEPPTSPFPENPAHWVSEQTLEIANDRIREFRAPVLEDGVAVAQVRIGFREPDLTVALQATSFHATLALLVFLLTPAAYVWLRREIKPLRLVAEALEVDRDEFERPHLAGRRLEIDGIVERFRDFNREIEERNEAMRRERVALLASSKVLAHEKQRSQVVLESLPDGLVVLDEAGRAVAVNARAEAILRRSAEDVVGSVADAWSPATEVTQLVRHYVGSSGRLQRSESVEFEIDALGERRFSASAHPLPEDSGYLVVLREITAEYVARKTQAEFLAHMAHELKAPLNVMSMYSESLLGPDAEDESFRVEACNVIRDEIDRLSALINNLFSIGRIESGHVTLDRQRIRLKDMLVDVMTSVARGGDELGLEFETVVPDDLPPVWADKPMLGIALKNILTNAVKYNRPQGKVSLVCTHDEQGLEIRIVDTGHGIPEEDVDRIFDKFYRAECEATQKIAGHGLGLALVKEIVALHGGEIRVSSQLGEGSTFAFFFAPNAAIFRGEA